MNHRTVRIRRIISLALVLTLFAGLVSGGKSIYTGLDESLLYDPQSSEPQASEPTQPPVRMEAAGQEFPAAIPEDFLPTPSLPAATEPAVSPEVTQPAVSPEATQPAVSPEATQPAVFPEATQPAVSPETIQNADRESLEQIADILDADVDTGDMDAEDLSQLVEDLLNQLENPTEPTEPAQEPTLPGAPGEDNKPENTDGITVNLGNSEEPELYDEDGAMTMPFDLAYPELVEQGEVKFDDETLLLKLSSGEITAEMAALGVAELTLVVPMGDIGWYEAKLLEGTDALVCLNALRKLDCVLMGELNYQIQTADIDKYEPMPDDEGHNGNGNFKNQWYYHHCGIPKATNSMKTNGGDRSVIVAVIDTGVDYDHEDLAGNIWINAGETPDNGIDDDRNGYIDDYYGVNIVAGKGNGDDDNGHGTHVAGIIAAQNNNLGVVGIAYNVQIMPIKAAMASGFLNQSDIAKAILYAYSNGAEVINMSFGGTACSVAVQDALRTAYSRCVLVASAGNEGMPNEQTGTMAGLPNYPAALTYVLGVISVGQDGTESSFSNWDVAAFNGVEYELAAPGEAIMSTLPGNQYGYLSGTSMASPVVAAMAAILRSEFADRNQYPVKFIYGQLAATSTLSSKCMDPELHGRHNLPMIVDLYAALTELPKPDVNMQDYAIFDTPGFDQDKDGKNNGDGVLDSGETVALGLTLVNRWGMSKDTVVTVSAANNGIEDPYITILNPTVNYGSVGTYSTQDCGPIYTNELLTGWENPFYIHISKDCPNDYVFTLKITITCGNALDDKDKGSYTNSATIKLGVRNGVVLPSIIDEDMVLTPDNHYILANSMVIQEGVTVRVEPGTHIQFYSNDPSDPYADQYMPFLLVRGTLLVEGTKENMVHIYPSDLRWNYTVEITQGEFGYISLQYADITNLATLTPRDNTSNYISEATGCVFRTNTHGQMYTRSFSNGSVVTSYSYGYTMADIAKMKDCVFYNIGVTATWTGVWLSGNAERCLFVDCSLQFNEFTAKDCVFLGNRINEDTTAEHNPANMDIRTNMEVLKLTQDDVKLVYRPETDTVYALIDYSEASHPAYPGEKMRFTMELAAALGGTPVVFNDVAEADWFVETFLTVHNWSVQFHSVFAYDWKTGECTFYDGTPIPAELNPSGYRFGEPYFYGNMPGFQMNWDDEAQKNRVHLCEYSSDRCLLEIPGKNLPKRTAEAVLEKLVNWFGGDNGHYQFRGNALLNRLSTDTDVNNWLRLIAVEGYETKRISLAGNYWGTTDERAIGLQLWDAADMVTLPQLDLTGYLTQAPENTFPFVTSVTVLNQDGEAVRTVGNELITVRVTFNRDMDTSIPLRVTFGSAKPYADYTLSGGEYVDKRTWECQYLLTTLIENGTQYFTISNGRSATDNLDLYQDWARFAFEIDTSAAQALILQGNATAEGINLTWTQDDFDTLMGYNVYRSTTENGVYNRINKVVIPADTMTFFDDTVQPGTQYYYNFTVVKTDLTESEASGRLTIMSLDTMAPDIYMSPVYNATTGSNILINATVTDNLSISYAKLYYRVTGQTDWKTVQMNALENTYSALIPAADVTVAGIEYYLEAFDGVNFTYKGSVEEPYAIAVRETVDVNALGDVNGDGRVSNLDALMVLQAINGKLNLTAEQFDRADLNGSGELQAMEALRILQYVSGTVGSLAM